MTIHGENRLIRRTTKETFLWLLQECRIQRADDGGKGTTKIHRPLTCHLPIIIGNRPQWRPPLPHLIHPPSNKIDILVQKRRSRIIHPKSHVIRDCPHAIEALPWHSGSLFPSQTIAHDDKVDETAGRNLNEMVLDNIGKMVEFRHSTPLHDYAC